MAHSHAMDCPGNLAEGLAHDGDHDSPFWYFFILGDQGSIWVSTFDPQPLGVSLLKRPDKLWQRFPFSFPLKANQQEFLLKQNFLVVSNIIVWCFFQASFRWMGKCKPITKSVLELKSPHYLHSRLSPQPLLPGKWGGCKHPLQPYTSMGHEYIRHRFNFRCLSRALRGF